MERAAGLAPREELALRTALAASARVLGSTSPNPPVGAVILDPAGEVAGIGVTAPPGGPHAEVAALAQAGARAAGGTAVVTLEPCNHLGRTGPCAQALLAAGIVRLVYGVADPNPVAAGGARYLQAHGVSVQAVPAPLAAEVRRGPLAAWLLAQELHRPLVIWKLAATLDGRVAAADGTSKWITSDAARADVALLRSQCDAIVAGVGTVLADDPHLTVRTPDGGLAARQPLRVVVDSNGRIPVSARVFDDAADTLLAVGERAPAPPLLGRAGAGDRTEIVRLPRAPGGLDLRALLAELHRREVRSVLVEGGPTLAGAFVAEGVVDRVVAYVAPALLGSTGRPALDAALTATISDVHRLDVLSVDRVGPDIKIVALRRVAGERAASCEPEAQLAIVGPRQERIEE